MNYTDTQLKQALTKMIPTKVYMNTNGGSMYHRLDGKPQLVLDTELLHLCWLVEKDLNPEQKLDYIEMLGRGEDEESFYLTIALASDWRWRVAALSRVKSIDIV
jgi:hypothetical protein